MNRIFTLAVLMFLCCIPSFAQKFQVSTNAIGWASLGTANVQLDYAVGRKWTVGLDARYNPFSFKRKGDWDRMQLKQRSLSAMARWWPWHVYSGWWVAGKFKWQEYNMGGIVSARTEEGNRFGAGISAGYTMMLGEHWNVEFGAGLWGGLKKYKVYACPKCGLKLEDGNKTFIMPNDVAISFAYVF